MREHLFITGSCSSVLVFETAPKHCSFPRECGSLGVNWCVAPASSHQADPGHGEVFQPPHITQPQARAIPCSTSGPRAPEGCSPTLHTGNLWRCLASNGMSLRKEDNKALKEIKVRSFWCESGGQTPSNPAPKGRSKAFKSLKPRSFGLSRELPSGSTAPSRCQAGGRRGLFARKGAHPSKGGAINAQIRVFSLVSSQWDGSKALHLLWLRVSQSPGIPKPELHLESSIIPRKTSHSLGATSRV